jgi:hypothetical protein
MGNQSSLDKALKPTLASIAALGRTETTACSSAHKHTGLVQHTALDPKQDAKASFYLCTWHVHNSQDPHKQQVKKRDPPKHSEITAV